MFKKGHNTPLASKTSLLAGDLLFVKPLGKPGRWHPGFGANIWANGHDVTPGACVLLGDPSFQVGELPCNSTLEPPA